MTEPARKKTAIGAHLVALHTYLALLAGVLLTVTQSGYIPVGSPLLKLLTGLAATFGAGAVASAALWQSPRVRAMLEEASPTPPDPADVVAEVKP